MSGRWVALKNPALRQNGQQLPKNATGMGNENASVGTVGNEKRIKIPDLLNGGYFCI